MAAANAATYSFGVAFARLHAARGRAAAVHRRPRDRWTSGSASTASRGSVRRPGCRPVSWPASWSSTVLAERPAAARGGRRWSSTGSGRPSTRSCSPSTGTWPSSWSEAGVELVAPEVGELVTSLDMAGCSLSVTWLDEELEGSGWPRPTPRPSGAATPWSASGSRPGVTVGRGRPRSRSAEASGGVDRRGRRGPPRRRGAVARPSRSTRSTWAGSTPSPATATTASACPAARRRPRRPRTQTEGGVQTVLAAAGRPSGTRPAGPAASSGGCCSTASARASATPTRSPPSGWWTAVGVRRTEPADASARPSSGTRRCSTPCSRSWTP